MNQTLIENLIRESFALYLDFNNTNSTDIKHQESSIQDAILLINTIFTLLTPLLFFGFKLIKRCQCGRNNFIETRSDPPTPPNVSGIIPRLASMFTRRPVNTNSTEPRLISSDVD